MNDKTFRFNSADSNELALFAFTRNREIGVDIEYIRTISEIEKMALGTFSPNENSEFRFLSADEKLEGFFNCWTRKEAFIKAIGEGLYYELDKFDVTLTPGRPARLLRVEGDRKEASRWTLHSFVPAPGYVAALAVEGKRWALHCLNTPFQS
jgi:4'-phosphopantetheinyl transferase